MAENSGETRLKTPKISSKAGLKSQIRQKKYTKGKSGKLRQRSIKCTREHILGHDWLIKIT